MKHRKAQESEMALRKDGLTCWDLNSYKLGQGDKNSILGGKKWLKMIDENYKPELRNSISKIFYF